jgi:hypothetical protein
MAFKEIINQVEAEEILAPVVETPAPVVEAPVPVSAPVESAPVEVAPVVVEPVAATPAPEASAHTTVPTEIVAPAAPAAPENITTPECDLKCFRECLELKKYVPFPVIQQCIEIRCHCQLDENAEKLSAISALYNFDAINKANEMAKGDGQGTSFLLNLIITILLFSVLSACIYVVYKLASKDEILYTKYFDDEGEMVYNEQPGYQRIL